MSSDVFELLQQFARLDDALHQTRYLDLVRVEGELYDTTTERLSQTLAGPHEGPQSPTYATHAFQQTARAECNLSAEQDHDRAGRRVRETAVSAEKQQTATVRESVWRLKRKRSSAKELVHSRYCHMCSTPAWRVQFAACSRIHSSGCCKIVCHKCFSKYSWDFRAVSTEPQRYVCPHCTRSCPPTSRCALYESVNATRKRARRAFFAAV
mmetsp:Transcript_13048/g.35105  ORF Transcript_13048/g.35105 Transcript_13048/m.35105 type:complete len:210 (+) Transcript_13048:125-754(+)